MNARANTGERKMNNHEKKATGLSEDIGAGTQRCCGLPRHDLLITGLGPCVLCAQPRPAGWPRVGRGPLQSQHLRRDPDDTWGPIQAQNGLDRVTSWHSTGSAQSSPMRAHVVNRSDRGSRPEGSIASGFVHPDGPRTTHATQDREAPSRPGIARRSLGVLVVRDGLTQ